MALDTVTVACRLPLGLHLDIHSDEVVLGACPRIKNRVTVAGSNQSALKVGGCGITEIAKDHWEAWYAKNKDLSYVKDGLIWATKTERDAVKEAKNREGDRTGFEGASQGDVRLGGDAKKVSLLKAD